MDRAPTLDALSTYCTFTADEFVFAVDVSAVQEVIRYQKMARVPLAPPIVSGLINLRGQIVTAIDLRRRLGLPARKEGQLPINVVIKRDEGPISLLVDEIDDVVAIDEGAIEAPPRTLRSRTGNDVVAGFHHSAHRLLLILALDKVLDIRGAQ